jgi:hypothetical protein
LINNLVNALYGQIQKTVTNGQVAWTLPCDPTNPNTQITNLPPIAGEGMLCYIIRGLQYAINNAYPVTLDGVQTLTNKTLTSPIVNTPTINTPTINSATINTATASNISITNAEVLGTLLIPNGTIAPAKLSTGGPNWDTSGNFATFGNSLYVQPLSANQQANINAVGTGAAGVTNTVQLYANFEEGGLYQTNNLPLSFRTNASLKMTIAADGNVGIGTNSPSTKLNVVTGSSSLGLDPNYNASGDCYVLSTGATNGLYVGVSDAKSVVLFTAGISRLSVLSNGTIDANTNPITNCPTTCIAKGSVSSEGTTINNGFPTTGISISTNSAGICTFAYTAVTANSTIIVTQQSAGYAPKVTITAGTGFTVTTYVAANASPAAFSFVIF